MSPHQLNNMNRMRIRIPKSWILLVVFIVSVIGAGAWVFTTPPDGKTNQTGIYFGNNSMNGNNVTADRIDVMNYFGTVVGTYLDSYSCDGVYCIYKPWYGSGNAYAKDMRTGLVYTSSNASDVFAVAISNMTDGGKLHISNGTYNACININQDKIVVEGEGWGTRISPCTSTGTAILVTGDYPELKSISVVGDGSVKGWGIDFNGSVRVQTNNIKVQNMGGGIKIVGVAGNTAHAGQYINTWVLNSTDSTKFNLFLAPNSFDSQFSNLWVGNGTYVGLRLESGANRFNNAHIWGNGTSSALDSVSIRSQANQFTNCYLESGADGVDIFGSTQGSADNNSFMNCYLFNNQNYGIRISTANNTKIIGSHFINNNRATGFGDIFVQNSNNSLIQDNTVTQGATGIVYNGVNNNNGIINNWGASPFYFGNSAGSALAPVAFGAGDYFYNTTSKAFNVWNGATWQYYNGTYVNAY